MRQYKTTVLPESQSNDAFLFPASVPPLLITQEEVEDLTDAVPHPLPSLCGFGFMLGCKIKAKEIKRLPLTGKANSASLLLEP